MLPLFQYPIFIFLRSVATGRGMWSVPVEHRARTGLVGKVSPVDLFISHVRIPYSGGGYVNFAGYVPLCLKWVGLLLSSLGFGLVDPDGLRALLYQNIPVVHASVQNSRDHNLVGCV